MSFFKKILVANRGEIARRIITTCKKMGIRTVAVYSDADADALFVREADESYHLGESPAKKSYLNGQKVLSIAKSCEVDAIHPGYGFLSENSSFALQCQEAGITFIGPDWKVIDSMGDKIKARQTMEEAGVPIVPGWNGDLKSIDQALIIASQLGYPLMLKASAGGGGIGMQLIRNDDELKKYFPFAKQTANSSFGDDTIFLERFIENARHIEVQVFGDNFGNVIHLFERECSIQRRNQKVIEESPSPVLSPQIRQKLCETAVKGVKKIGYTNAGTVEFLYDELSGDFYFLEMNTRLQVEHPITEKVTGLDLVELQIKVAAGEELKMEQEDIKQIGYALEARLYAEDPKTYFPSPGKLTKLTFPVEKSVRLDFSVEENSSIPPFYDPMIGKIIVHEESRNKALKKMNQALNEFKIEGIKTNLSLLKDIINDPKFIDGEYTTHFLETRSLKEKIRL
ncbi:acetyl-CoA carboxylase biotin carboxylase subunit [Sporosarcina psychrophila]|uniref:acetyl-CoA carboxylase biotin carboxylase subunit n=1 Tax=Sporosarcina psychrophila TaxID=1476 RepID=UPI00078E7B76|nr:acetyl-CoA carboxylase biotin carboxylase subunit [Sporosarcina psychrophila]AMQ07843.1 biotin carboxylase [Sporosarcina psychrophila]